MPTKTCAVLVKTTAADDPNLEDGQFTALASVFNNVDAVGDVVMPGAFTDTLTQWSASGDPIPLLWGHDTSDPNKNIGAVLAAAETAAGLQVKAQLDLENPTAQQVYRLLKGRRVRKMSFAYDIDDGAQAERDGQSVYELRKLTLHEVSVVQIPANPATTIQQVKDAADRRAANLKTADGKVEALTLIKQALAILASTEDAPPLLSDDAHGTSAHDSTDDKAIPAVPATAEEPTGVKTDSPAQPGPASVRLRNNLVTENDELFSLTD